MSRRRSLPLVAMLFAARFASAQGVPATDIFLAPLDVAGHHVTVGAPANVTNRPGYDNQPSFTLDGRAILYTSIGDDGQADIYRYDLASKQRARVTTTPESEYSATPMAGGSRFSVIRVEHDSAQRLWSFAMNGTDPQLVIAALKPVGYHAWLRDGSLVMFVLGSPNALVHGDPRTGKVDTLARGIGRSIAALPDGSGFSFTQPTDSGTVLRARTWPGSEVRDLTLLPRGAQDMAWVANDVALAGDGTRLLAWDGQTRAWSVVAEFANAGLTQVTRLAISPDRKSIAIVAVPRVP